MNQLIKVADCPFPDNFGNMNDFDRAFRKLRQRKPEYNEVIGPVRQYGRQYKKAQPKPKTSPGEVRTSRSIRNLKAATKDLETFTAKDIFEAIKFTNIISVRNLLRKTCRRGMIELVSAGTTAIHSVYRWKNEGPITNAENSQGTEAQGV